MDKETAEKLYHSCYMKVYSYVMTLAKNEDAASEITQETFFRAISTKQTFRGESECYSWLCAIAKNIFIDGTRKASRNQGELLSRIITNVLICLLHCCSPFLWFRKASENYLLHPLDKPITICYNDNSDDWR